MPFETPTIKNEAFKKCYPEEVFRSLPKTEIGVGIARVSPTRLETGRESNLKLSVREKLAREGWDLDALNEIQKGDTVLNITGETFEVIAISKKVVKIRNTETGFEGEIIAKPRTIQTHEYIYQIYDSSKRIKKIKVIDAIYKDRTLDTAEFIDALVRAIPIQCVDTFDAIEIHRLNLDKAGSFRVEPFLFSNRKILTVYVNGEGYPIEEIKKTIYHELGHSIVKYLRGSVNPGEQWKQNMQLDGNAISEYAEKTRYPKENDQGETEDFADSIMLYLAIDGIETEKNQSLWNLCRNRFSKLNEIFSELDARQKTSVISSIKKRVFKSNRSL